jgi:hypothetical protein
MWNALRFASYCGSSFVFSEMPETLQKKKIRLYNHFIAAMEKPMEHPMLHQILLNNAYGYSKSQSPEEIPDERRQTRDKLLALERRLFMLEHNVCPAVYYWLGQLARKSKQRIAMLEQRQELLARVLVKLTKRKQ